jgi:rhodanese-related sulfurtransferase
MQSITPFVSPLELNNMVQRGGYIHLVDVRTPAEYEGRTVTTIGEERRFNPRLQVDSRQAYVDQMNSLALDPPRLIDVAVPANRKCGLKMAA